MLTKQILISLLKIISGHLVTLWTLCYGHWVTLVMCELINLWSLLFGWLVSCWIFGCWSVGCESLEDEYKTLPMHCHACCLSPENGLLHLSECVWCIDSSSNCGLLQLRPLHSQGSKHILCTIALTIEICYPVFISFFSIMLIRLKLWHSETG